MAAASIIVDLLMRTGSFETDTKRAESSLRRLQKTSTDVTASLRGLAASFGLGFSVVGLVNLTDQYTKLTAQLKLSTSSLKEFNEAYASVQRIANNSQTDINAVATLYARLGQTFKDTGVSQKEIADISETVALALKVNGASAQEASSAMLQLSQAFGSGVLRGEEFNAIAEAAPPLLRQVAKTLGVTYGELRQLAKDGKITEEVLRRAFTDKAYIDSLRNSAKEIQTVSGAITVLKNNLETLVGEYNSASGATNTLTKIILTLANNLNIVAGAALAVTAAFATMYSARVLAGLATLQGRLSAIVAVATAGAVAIQNYFDSQTGDVLLNKRLEEAKKRLIEINNILSNPNDTKRTDRGLVGYTKAEIDALTKERDTLVKRIAGLQDMVPSTGAATPDVSIPKIDIPKIATPRGASRGQSLSDFQLDVQLSELERIADEAKKAGSEIAQVNDIIADSAEDMADRIRDDLGDDGVIKSLKDMDAEIARLAQSTRTPLEQFESQIQRIADLFNKGWLSPDLAGRLSDQAFQEFVDKNKDVAGEVTEFWKEAARNIQDAFADGFFDFMQGEFGNLEQSFKRTIDRMVANLLASKLTNLLFGESFGTNGDIGGDSIIGKIFGGFGDFFGDLLPSFDVGTPYVQRDMVAKIHKGERILTAQENRAFSSGGMGATVYMTVNTPDANSFRKSQPQIMADMQRNLNRGRRVV
jgi:tape measure domain-containing protein